MGKALYRKYRSKSLDEIVGQKHITQTLTNALKNGQISHAYLFTGPRGVGKTSVARILAHAVNNLPYTHENNHIDIIEIDAASNRRIDEIRDLRDKVNITPTSAKYKVYIIDEVHMLTREAFNALLKTLEEPPDHVIFILATTEAHKLPETIVSRTQRFSFKPINEDEAVAHLRTIAKTENITIDDQALQLIAQHGSGSFRDSISLLDQASNLAKKIELADIEHLLGIAPETAVDQLKLALTSRTPKEVVQALAQLKEQGYQSASIAKQLAASLRSDLLAETTTLPTETTTVLLGQLLSVPSAHDPDSFLELTLLAVALEGNNHKRTEKDTVNETAPTTPKIDKPSEAKPAPPVNHAKRSTKTNYESVEAAWPSILATLKDRHNTLYSVVRMAEPEWSEDQIVLKFAFPFHQKRLQEAKNQQVLLDIISELTGQQLSIKAVIDNKEMAPSKNDIESKTEVPVDNISNIFGSVEMLD